MNHVLGGWAASLALALLSFADASAQESFLQGIETVDYQLVSSEQAGKGRNRHITSVYRVIAGNTTEDFGLDILGAVTSTDPAIRVIKGEAEFGDIRSQSSTFSADPIVIRRGADVEFNPASLQWAFSGFLVVGAVLPPNPGPEGDLTVEGVDTNLNGIRDDLERTIARRAPGNVPLRASMNQLAATLQGSLSAGESSAQARAHAPQVLAASECLLHVAEDDSTEILKWLENRFTNTIARLQAYLEFNDRLHGAVFGDDEFPSGAAACEI